MQQLLRDVHMHRYNYSLWCNPWGNHTTYTPFSSVSLPSTSRWLSYAVLSFSATSFISVSLLSTSSWLSYAVLSFSATFFSDGCLLSVRRRFWSLAGLTSNRIKTLCTWCNTIVYEIIIELTNAKFYNMTNLSVVFAFWALEEGFGTWLGPQQSVLWLHWAASSFSAQQIAPPCLLHPWLFEVWLHQNTAPMRVVQGPVSPWEGRQNTFGMPRMLHLEQ